MGRKEKEHRAWCIANGIEPVEEKPRYAYSLTCERGSARCVGARVFRESVGCAEFTVVVMCALESGRMRRAWPSREASTHSQGGPRVLSLRQRPPPLLLPAPCCRCQDEV